MTRLRGWAGTSTLTKKNGRTFQWHIADASGNAVNDCDSVIATLYAGRSATNPDLIPGLPVPSFTSVSFTSTPELPGLYEGDIAATFDPLAGTYRLVVEARRRDALAGHWETDIQVVV
jgi:hypothetical protein